MENPCTATMSMNCGYFHSKQKDNRKKKELPCSTIPLLLIAYIQQLEMQATTLNITHCFAEGLNIHFITILLLFAMYVQGELITNF